MIITKFTLYMYFYDSSENKFRLVLKDVREDITASEVSNLANKIIEKNMFTIKHNSLAKYIGAEMERTETTTL